MRLTVSEQIEINQFCMNVEKCGSEEFGREGCGEICRQMIADGKVNIHDIYVKMKGESQVDIHKRAVFHVTSKISSEIFSGVWLEEALKAEDLS